MEDYNEGSEYEEEEEQPQEPQQAASNLLTKLSHEAKLKELLRNLTSNELKLCYDAAKEFVKLLKSSAGPEILNEYIQTSSKCIELSRAWDLRKSKPGGLSCILKLISAILDRRVMGGDSRTVMALDKFARGIVEERLGDVYRELNSKDGKRQKAALLLLASVVRRGPGLAWDVAKRFDFKMASFGKLAEWKRRRGDEGKRKHWSTRKSFVGFAMSFLEVGNPRLLREVLQQKGMYSGVLRGLGNDDEETVVYVLTTLRSKLLVPESLVPPGLRSVLFGSVTLEQLASVSGREDGGLAAEVAHNVLIMVCTDSCNGLMPDLERKPSPLRGNPKRLFDFMKKLKATEFEHHKDLLLAMVKGRPSFGSAYLDGFPYNLDDLSSPNWFAAVSLAADVVSAVADGLTFSFINSFSQEPPAIDNLDMQNIINCIGPRPFSRLIINKGLLHTDPLMKHATLKLLLEVLKLLDSLFDALKSISFSSNWVKHRWESLKQEIESELRMSLPDPQVLLSLLSSFNSHYKSLDSSLKRPADAKTALKNTANSQKRLKTENVNQDMDIIISGVGSSPDITLHEDDEQIPSEHDMGQPHGVADIMKLIGGIWNLDQGSLPNMVQKDGDSFFYSKLFDALRIYHRTMPNALEGSFDFFKVLPSNPLSLPDILQRSLLSLLVEHVGWSSKGEIATRTLTQMYKHLHPFVNLLMHSPIRDVKNQAYLLARTAMLSTGAFDKNPREICSWFLFIPGYSRENTSVEDHGIEIVQKLSSVIVSFLCDAVSTTGNNLFKYLDLLRHYVYDVQGAEGACPAFSPFVICVLEKCLRLLSSEFRTFTLPEKTMISVYVCNTLKYLLETQAEAGLLSSLIDLLLSGRLQSFPNIDDIQGDYCEWRPMKILLDFSRNIVQQKTVAPFANVQEVSSFGGSLAETLAEVERVLESKYDDDLVGVTIALSYSILCTKPEVLLRSFPSAITISTNLYGIPLLVLSSLFYLEPGLLSSVSKLWPAMFLTGGEMFISGIQDEVTTKKIVGSMDFKPIESASAAFCFFLDMAPCHVLFPAILWLDGSTLFHNLKTISLLIHKISGTMPDYIFSAFCHVLFWLNQAKISYKTRPLDGLEGFSERCIIFIEHMLKQVLVGKIGCDLSSYKLAPLRTQYIQEVAEVIFCHPAVVATLESPLPGSEDYTDVIFGGSLEKFLELAEKGIHKMDRHVLKLLRTTCEQLLSFCESKRLSEGDKGTKEIAKVFKGLKKKLLMTLKDRFDGCLKSRDLVPLIPISFALHSLLRFISPFELLELVHWFFSKIDLTDTASSLSFRRSALLASLHIAGCAFDLLSAYLQEPRSEETLFALFWGMEEKAINVSLFEKIFFQVYEIASRFELDVADICLLKALRVVKLQQALKHCIPSIMVMSRVVANIPVNLLSRCMHTVTRTKSLLVFSLAELSSLHLSIFGHLFATVINKLPFSKADLTRETCNYHLSDEELMMLLPIALLYLDSAIIRFRGLQYQNVGYIPSLYWRMLSHGFSDWKSYVSRQIFEIELSEAVPQCPEQLLHLLSTSLLGKSVRMVHHHLALSGESVKMGTRLNLFDSLYLHSSKTDDLFDCNLSQVGSYSLGQCLNIVNRAAAKIYFCRLLLFPEHVNFGSMLAEVGDVEDVPPEMNSNALDLSRIRFLNILVRSWHLIVKKFPSNIDRTKEEGKKYSLFKFLENLIGRNILDLTAEMKDCLVKLPCLTFVEQLAKSTLLHRFEDTGTLQMLQTVLTMLSEGKFPCVTILQLLLAHSEFAETIHSVNKSGSTSVGMIFTPMPSILRSLAVHDKYLNSLDRESKMHTFEYMKQLEIIKLVRVLLRISAQQCDLDSADGIEVNLRELVLLLLSSYSATLSEIDLEIYNLISEIESVDKSCTESLGKVDYLWGIAASTVRKEREQDSSFDLHNTEVVEELRKIQFRENFPVDPKLCAATVLNFPHFRAVGEITPDNLQKDNFENVTEGHSSENWKRQTYDPVFILRFSIHCLSMGYVEPLEFASSGLLAITIASLSSPHDDLRKLGYQALGRFKLELERSQKRKDITRLRLLLSYLQNGIEQPWQKISSITAVFVAEATLVLLNSSHDYYSTINKLLMRSPSANMKNIPLFQNFFWSSSVNFNGERSWMLRLLYTGLNTDDAAHIYIRNSVFEIVLSFYLSPLSDDNSKELILQMLKKSIKLHRMARYLVEQCGLIPWLSSVISSYCGSQSKDNGRFPLTQLTVGLEVLNDVISSRNMVEWLQKSALEQISEFSTHLYEFLVGRTELIKEQTSLLRLCLHILASALKISQKRKVYQPHFTLSTEGLLQLCEAINVCSSGRCSHTAELGLKVILMSTPAIDILHMDPEKLLKFVSWATSIALQAKARQGAQPEESFNLLTVSSEGENSNDSLVSKLLRWLAAAVILGRLSWRLTDLDFGSLFGRSNPRSLHILLEWPESGPARNPTEEVNEETLAASIIYLQQLLGINCKLLPSVVSALCLLFITNSSGAGAEVSFGHVNSFASLCSKISWPAEANPSWRWSYYQPWRDFSSQPTETARLEEIHACQMLLVEISNMLGRKSLYSQFLSLKDVENCRVFEWERSIIQSE